MKRLLFAILLLCVLSQSADARPAILTFGDFVKSVRLYTQLHSTSLCPDSLVYSISRMSITAVSTEIGGVQSRVIFRTTKNDPHYVMPDTVVNIIGGCLIKRDGSTFSLRSWYPEFFDQLENATLPGESDAERPVAFKYWKDTVQLYPIPKVSDDTVRFDVFVEHEYCDTTTDTIRFGDGDFTIAAIYLACRDLCAAVSMPDKVDLFQKMYDAKAAKLEQAVQRKFDVLQGGKQ